MTIDTKLSILNEVNLKKKIKFRRKFSIATIKKIRKNRFIYFVFARNKKNKIFIISNSFPHILQIGKGHFVYTN